MSCNLEHLENVIGNVDSIDYDNFESSVGYCLDIRHIVVELDGVFIDNNGVYESTNQIKHCEGVNHTKALTIDILEVWNKKVQWNHSFDRSQIYLIEQKLNKCYEKFEKGLVESI